MPYLLSHWHHIVYFGLAAFFIVIYIVHFLPFKGTGRLKALIETENILILVLIFVAIIAYRVEQIETHTESKWEGTIESIDRLESRMGSAKIERLESLDLFRRAMSEALIRTQHEVWATAFRPESLTELVEHNPQTGVWLSDLDRWRKAESGRNYRRLVGIGNDTQRQWFQDECGNRSKLPTMILRAIEMPYDHTFVNVVVFDDDEVFLTFRKRKDIYETALRYRIFGKEFATFGKTYFSSLWANANSCAE